MLKGSDNPDGHEEVHRLHARSGLPEGAARQHVRLPGRHLGGARPPTGRRTRGSPRTRSRSTPPASRRTAPSGCASGGTSPASDRAGCAGGPRPSPRSRWRHSCCSSSTRWPACSPAGLWPDGTLDLGGVAEVLGRPRTHRVLWFTVWSAGAATLVSVVAGLPVAFVLHRLRFPGRDLLRALVVVPFVLPTVVVGVAFRQLIAPSGPLGPLGLDGTATAIVAALVFFNISVVVRTVGAFWEAIDPRREEAAAVLGAISVAGVPHRDAARRSCPGSSRRPAWCSCSARPPSASSSPWAGCATPTSRPRSTCSPPRSSTSRGPPRSRSCSWSSSPPCSPSPRASDARPARSTARRDCCRVRGVGTSPCCCGPRWCWSS